MPKLCIWNRVTRWKSSPPGDSDIQTITFPDFERQIVYCQTAWSWNWLYPKNMQGLKLTESHTCKVMRVSFELTCKKTHTNITVWLIHCIGCTSHLLYHPMKTPSCAYIMHTVFQKRLLAKFCELGQNLLAFFNFHSHLASLISNPDMFYLKRLLYFSLLVDIKITAILIIKSIKTSEKITT